MPETKIHKYTNLIEETKLNAGPLTRQAIIETANEIGGPDLAEEVSAKFTTEELLRDDSALHHLENLESGAIRRVEEKAGLIQQEASSLEKLETEKSLYRKFGSYVLKLISRK